MRIEPLTLASGRLMRINKKRSDRKVGALFLRPGPGHLN
jgi:hypothetical protein